MKALLVEPYLPIRSLVRKRMGVEECLIFASLSEVRNFPITTEEIGVIVLGLDQTATDEHASGLFHELRKMFPSASFIAFATNAVFGFTGYLETSSLLERNFILRPNVDMLIAAIRMIVNPNGQPPARDEEIDEEE